MQKLHLIKRILLFACIASILSACQTSNQVDTEAQPTALPLAPHTTFTVQRGTIIKDVKLFGRVGPLSEHTINFLSDGTVRNVYINPGDQVAAGQLLADLRVDNLEVQLADARQAAADEEMRAYNRIRRAEIDLEIAQLTLDGLQAAAAPDFEQGIQRLRVELAQMNLEEVKANPDLIPSAEIVKDLETRIEAAALFSPVSGTVISVITPGRQVQSSTPAIIIGDVSQFEGSVTAEITVLELLTEGSPVEVVFEKSPEQSFMGIIRQLPYPYGSGESGAGSTVRVTFDTSSMPDFSYVLGDKISVRVILAQVPDALWLPPQAVRNLGGRVFVMVQENGALRRIEVKIGLETRDQVEILEGLEAGQEVVAP